MAITTLFLAQDSEGIKAFDEELSAWTLVSQPPITQELILVSGTSALPNSLNGLGFPSTLLCYTDDEEVDSDIDNYKLFAHQIVTSKPKTIIQNADFIIPSEKLIEKAEMRANVVGGKVKSAISADSGASWLTFKNDEFIPINIADQSAFLQDGISPENFANFNISKLNEVLNATIRLAYILEKPNLSDICKLKAVKITYVQ